MQRLRTSIALVSLIVITGLGLSWNLGRVEAEESGECNCIDGFSGLSGQRQWDPAQERFRCVVNECYVITQ